MMNIGELMPIYEYRCECMHEFEVEQPIGSAPLEACPVCGQESLVRLISRTHGIVSREVTTLGQLAEKNSKKAGSFNAERTANEKKTSREGLKEFKKIASMSEEQKKKYIEG
jgi:putative FmdB family regulatory protein